MEIKKLVLGLLQTNCYILIKDKHCLIIDPAAEAEKIKNICKPYIVEGILVTHHHFDHILALNELEETYNIKHNTFNTPSFSYEVIKTPGHKSDSLTFYFQKEKVMFTGDFIFYHTCGRCDLDTGSIKEMKNSLKLISSYPDDSIIYPGHGPKSILGEEKPLFNNYLN